MKREPRPSLPVYQQPYHQRAEQPLSISAKCLKTEHSSCTMRNCCCPCHKYGR